MKIYHNPRCTKSRETLELIRSKGIEPEVIEYLKTPPSVAELKSLLQMLGISAEALIRKGEAEFKDNFKGKVLSENEWIEVLTAHPKLIERPIVVANGKAVIGRPPQNVEVLL
jgi:arsenate reductase